MVAIPEEFLLDCGNHAASGAGPQGRPYHKANLRSAATS